MIDYGWLTAQPLAARLPSPESVPPTVDASASLAEVPRMARLARQIPCLDDVFRLRSSGEQAPRALRPAIRKRPQGPKPPRPVPRPPPPPIGPGAMNDESSE
jgi:hypothetical protein